MRSLRKPKRLLILVLVLGIAIVTSFGSVNAASIGIDASGTSTFTTIDHLNYYTDTGLALGFNFGATVPPDPQYDIDFILQGRVSGGTLNTAPVNIPGINDLSKEVTFVARFNETVVEQGINSTGPYANFFSGENTSSIFQLWADPTPDTVANGPTGVLGYGDGTNILSAHLLGLTSVFQSSVAGQVGNGQFTVRLGVDSYNPNYLNLGTNEIVLVLQTTGTLGQPSDQTGGIIPPPVKMWDGTSTTSGDNPQLFKFDGSTGFEIQAVPEPSTIFLLGAGLLGLGVVARKKIA